MGELKYLAAGVAIGFLVRKFTEPRQRVVAMPCEEEEFNIRSGAAAVLTLCDACETLAPVMRPMARGELPSISTLRDAFL